MELGKLPFAQPVPREPGSSRDARRPQDTAKPLDPRPGRNLAHKERNMPQFSGSPSRTGKHSICMCRKKPLPSPSQASDAGASSPHSEDSRKQASGMLGTGDGGPFQAAIVPVK